MVNPGYQKKVAAITLLLHVLLFAGTEFDAPGAAEIQRVQPKDVLNSSQGTEAKGGYITMNFKDVDILILIKFISELTGRNFLVDPDVRGNVTILSPQKVTVDEAYRVFLSVLEVHGFTAVRAGKIIKIIKSADAKAKGVETIWEKGVRSPSDRIITQLVPLRHGAASDFAKFLRPLIPKTGLMIPYPETNTLIIIDMASNVDRLLGIIHELDVPGAEERIDIFSLEHANAEKLANKSSLT